MKRERKGKLLWDQPIENEELIKRWLTYFKMLLSLDKVKFRICVKPPNVVPGTEPNLITFNDGNPLVFATMAYTLFKVNDQSDDRKYVASLLMFKAKLGPLAHIGETYRNELCSATYAA